MQRALIVRFTKREKVLIPPTPQIGFNSSKTTETYTHVSTKSLQQIISPFDDL
ncbi:MAG: hypothetical protein V4620_00670 [Bacteroidota bacterium]